MTFADWMEPAIKSRIDHITIIIENQTENIDGEFNKCFELLKRKHKESVTELLILESLFARRVEIIETAYRLGLEDGVRLRVLK